MPAAFTLVLTLVFLALVLRLAFLGVAFLSLVLGLAFRAMGLVLLALLRVLAALLTERRSAGFSGVVTGAAAVIDPLVTVCDQVLSIWRVESAARNSWEPSSDSLKPDSSDFYIRRPTTHAWTASAF